MSWRNSFVRSSSGERPSGDIEEPRTSQPGRLYPPSEKLTGHQFFYLFVVDGLGAMIVSAGVNTAIAYAMYRNQTNIRLFQLPNTLAGDAGVTIILQCIITWLIELFLVTRDLRSAAVQPIGFIPQPQSRTARWLLFFTDPPFSSPSSLPASPTEQQVSAGDSSPPLSPLGVLDAATQPGPSPRRWPLFIASHAFRGFLLAMPSFIIFWGPTVGILTTLGQRNGGDWDFNWRWTPLAFKALLGGILGLVTTPVMAGFWLTRAGWIAKELRIQQDRVESEREAHRPVTPE